MLADPIVALATAAGRSALAVVRLSGEGVFDVARQVITGFRAQPPRTATLATFHAADGTPIDRGLYTVFPAPASYTGEDMVELSCHGGLSAPAQLVAALQAAGARPAAPGEFTRRAVLNGRMDLLQAEAVGDLIDANAPAQARVALAQLDGGLSRRLAELRGALVELQAQLGYAIDFPEEDDGPVPIERMSELNEQAAERIERLMATASAGERLREGALVVLAGRPNAGKSSLFNALLGTARALVTETPGTTRDAIEAPTDVLGWPVRLVDTAGLWESEDAIDRLGIEVSRRYLAAADLVLLCVEGTRPLGPDEAALLSGRPVVVVRTKSDLGAEGSANHGDHAGRVSARTGDGLDGLRRRLAAELFGAGTSLADLEPRLTRERHRVGLGRAYTALQDAATHLVPGGDPVLASHHVREAGLALDELIGAIDVEDVLERVFATFCVGK